MDNPNNKPSPSPYIVVGVILGFCVAAAFNLDVVFPLFPKAPGEIFSLSRLLVALPVGLAFGAIGGVIGRAIEKRRTK
jgi:hypothetical protein